METISAQNIKTNMLEGQKWFGMAPIALVRVLPSKYDNGERKNMKTVSAKILKQIC